jgi:hypothetical protein
LFVHHRQSVARQARGALVDGRRILTALPFPPPPFALDGAWPFGAWLVAFVFTQMVEIPIYVTGLRNVVGDVTWTVADAAIGLGESCTLPRKRLY